jgi:hypothetical protein
MDYPFIQRPVHDNQPISAFYGWKKYSNRAFLGFSEKPERLNTAMKFLGTYIARRGLFLDMWVPLAFSRNFTHCNFGFYDVLHDFGIRPSYS